MKPDGPVPLLVAYAPTSTTDQQNPEESLRWQLDAARTLRAGRAEIVAVAHDKETSRSLPWSQRKGSARPTRRLYRTPPRSGPASWSASPSVPLATRARSRLCSPSSATTASSCGCPSSGGPVDPASEIHDIILLLFGGLSRAERNSSGCGSGRPCGPCTGGALLGGRPPYGYRLVRTGLPHPNPERARQGIQLTKLADAIFGGGCVGKL